MGDKKGGGGGIEVSDYLMSIDYGVCYGEVDSINQIYVKDKPIWCGSAKERVDIPVNQPDLFGGDGGEGGVVGVVECYMGTEDQYVSAQLAERMGRTPLNTPGYRGLCHLFFRGGQEADTEEEALTLASWTEGVLEGIMEVLTGNSGATDRGFRWATNNPYLPGMDVNLTRIPKGLNTDEAKVYPPIIDENGDLAPDPDGILQAPEGLVNPANLTEIIPVWFEDAIPPLDSVTDPWLILAYDNYTDDELDLIALQGWSPVIRINVDIGYLDENDEAVTDVNHRFSLVQHDINGNPTTAVDAENVTVLGEERMVFSKEVELHEDTRFVYLVMTVKSNGNELSGGVAEGSIRTAELFFTDHQGEAYGENSLPFTEKGSPDIEDDGHVVTLAEHFSQSAIDAGYMKVRVMSQMVAGKWALAGGGGQPFNGAIYVRGYGSKPDGTIDWNNSIRLYDPATAPDHSGSYTNTPFSTDGPSDGLVFASTGPLTTRPGTTHIAVFTNAARPSQVLSQWALRRSSISITGTPSLEVNVHCEVNGTLGKLPDANPAHIIYECLVNKDWGKGEDPAMIDLSSFQSASTTLFGEYFGLSMGFFQQDTIEAFVQEVLDHIQAFLFQHPATGLWTLKLLRDDYEIEEALHVNEKNATLRNQKRPGWGETINEINVAYTAADTEETATVTSHNLGNIAMNGGVNSETREYYGIRNEILAKIVADRDVESAGYPVFSCQAEVGREFWRTVPGDVVTLSWDEEGLDYAVMRVMNVDYGSPKNRTIVLNLSEDIFALEQTSYNGGQKSLLESERTVATPLDYETIVSAPAPVLMRNGMSVQDIDDEEPAVVAAIMGDQTPRPISIKVYTEVVKGNGDVVVEAITSVPVTRSDPLQDALVREARSDIAGRTVRSIFRGNEGVGEIMMLGVDEEASELVMLNGYSEAEDTWEVIRGLWDTVPLAWPSESRVWAFPLGYARADPGERAAGETRTYRLLPKTSFNTLAYAAASDLEKTFIARPHAPFRPAATELDGNGFDLLEYRDSAPANIEATWVNRNRGTEDQVALQWDDGNQTPEVGQTTTLEVYEADGTFSHEYDGLSGTSHTISVASLSPVDYGYIKFVSVRDEVKSLWGAELWFDLRSSGYGYVYGLDYGGPEA